MNGKPTIAVMADYGSGPYAWRRENDEEPGIGPNVGDAVCGFSDEYRVSPDLEKAFALWAVQFERESGRENFPWESWNAEGIELARRLEGELGDRFNVEYHYPVEDPSYTSMQRPIVAIE